MGLVVSNVPVESVYNVIKHAGNGMIADPALKVDLMDINGNIIYSNHDTAGMMKDAFSVDEWKLIESIKNNSGSIIHRRSNHQTSLVVFAREHGYLDYKGSGWQLVIAIPARIAFAPATRMRNNILAALSLFGACYILIIMAILKKWAKPINQLQKAVQELSKGNFDVHIQTDLKDEIGNLINIFNVMTLSLKEETASLENEIIAHNRAKEEKKELWAELVQSEKLAAIGELSSKIAHQIANPISAILLQVQFMLDGLSATDPFYKDLKSIETESRRSKEYLDGITAFARKGSAEKEKCSLNNIVKDVSLLIETRAKGTPVNIIKYLSEDTPEIYANRAQMQHLIVNLCNNSIDAMPAGGTLTVKSCGRYIDGKRYAEVTVEDTGMGIPGEVGKKIFEPFYTTKAQGKGTGLGLTLVNEIIKLHNGSIDFESEINKGTKFTLLLPA
jgi:two-component system NtrC family sensor kinase